MGEHAIRNKKRGRNFRGEKILKGKKLAFLYIEGNLHVPKMTYREISA
jgi:hypothetical protein